MESKRTKLGSRAVKRVPRGTQEAQNGAPEGPSWSKWRPKRLQIETKRCQNGLGWSQKCPHEGLMMQNRNIEKTSKKLMFFIDFCYSGGSGGEDLRTKVAVGEASWSLERLGQ